MKYPKILLTEDQRKEFTQITETISEWEIAKHYTLSQADIQIVNQHRKDYNRIGFALQLCYLRYPGWTLTNLDNIPSIVIFYIAKQINADTKDLTYYGQRENTRLKHLQELREIYGYRFYIDDDNLKLEEYLILHAMENDNYIRLIKLAIEYLSVYNN